MARKRRTKTPAKRNNRRKSDSDQNSNGLSDGSEGVSKQESGSEDRNDIVEVQDEDSKTDSFSDESHYNPYAEKNHKHPKFRYLERRHSSSNDEDSEYNTCDLMPQQIQDIVLGDVKAVIISQDDIANDTCLQGHIEHEEVIGNSMECETSEVELSVSSAVSVHSKTEPRNSKTVENSDLVKVFEKTVQINEHASVAPDKVSDKTDMCAKNPPPIQNKKESFCIIIEDSSSLTENKELVEECKKPEDLKKCDAENKKNQSDDSGRRRSNRIRVNRWTDDEVKVPVPPEVPAVPLPLLPPNLFDSDKPVKVKSRWRRTSELEMGSSSGGSQVIENDVPNSTPILRVSPEIQSTDPQVDEGLKSFEIISHNIFLTPRGPKKERLVCECTLSKEEISKGEFGCGDDCLNRLLMIECGSRCSLGNLCSNRQFQNCQYTPCQVVKTKKKGLGLITTVNVGPGTFLMEYVGEVLESKEFRRRAKEYAKEKNAHYYFMQLESSHVIDATVKGNISRFINHSCDPNSETQKWTVNGEIRIGFFSKKAISAGEEITFDYKLDRYGREAQKCYCEAPNCRGWIGETPEAEREKTSKKEKKEKKKEKKKEFLSDREMEYEVEKLVASGVKNQKHTLTLSRLMVRAEEESYRRQLLEVARGADVRCLRLFLDYHGLSLLWSYMVDNHSSSDLKLDILNTLAILPISNRTVLQDSKVLNVVRKWAKKEDTSLSSKDRNLESGEDSISPPTDNSERIEKEPMEKDEELEKKIVEKAHDLLSTWDNLKHEYRIPKKEKIEQMKEHEREANRGYSDPWETKSNDRHWNYEKENRSYDKESRYNRDRKRGRESPESDWRKSRGQDERQNGGVNRLSKTERRQLFAMKVEEEDRQRKLEEDWAKQHAAHMLGPPPAGPPPNLDQGFFPQPPPFHPPPEGGEMVYGSCPPAFPPPYMGPPPQPGGPPFMDGPPPQPGGPPFMDGPPSFPPQGGPPPPGGFHPPPFSHPNMPPPYQPSLPQYPPFPYNPPPQQSFPPTPRLSAPPLPTPSLPAASLPSTASLPPPNQAPVIGNLIVAGPPPPPPPLPHVFPIKLPPKWRSAKDKEGRIYYYHTKTRKSQWQIPTEDTVQNVQSMSDTESDSDDSTEDDESSTEEEEDEKDEEEYDFGFEEVEPPKKDDEDEVYVPEEMKFEDVPIPHSIVSSLPPVLKKRREGLVEINIISPRDGEDDYRCGITKKQIREKKEARAREKRRQRSSGAAKCVADSSVSRLPPKQKVKVFRAQMANEIVALLNPYRKADCKTARITTTEDFKFLARKLTHFVTLKELRHCATPEELVYNDKVRHKAKDFVRKYMAKFGYLYKKSSED